MSKVSKLGLAIYVIVAICTILAYVSVRSILIHTQPGMLVISNLTVNYITAAFLTGALTGWWSYERLLKRFNIVIRIVGTVFFTVIVAVGWLVVMSMGGYQIRWVQ